MSQFDFSELTPDLILDAIESIGVYPESGLLPLNSYENRVYQFVAEDKQRYVAKFYRPERWTNEQILEEHQYSIELAEQDIGVVAPLIFNGNTLFHFNGYRFCLFPSVGGRMFELDNLDQLEWLGRLLGRMHQVARQQPFKHRTQINVADELALARDIIADSSMVPMHLTSTFFHDLDMLIAKTLPLSQVNAESIRLHGDCHSGNILLTYKEGEEEATLVDLDDCLTGPAVQDIWMMLSGDRQQQLLQLDTIVSAYEEFSDFDRAELALIEPLRTRRMINYMAWIALRWQDPAFPRNFSWFATDKYWEQQILAIKEQLAALDDAPLRLGL
jgi:Ser/Thr protein kinase RdoA (MazF antagonist)